jgi:hypothetical protein
MTNLTMHVSRVGGTCCTHAADALCAEQHLLLIGELAQHMLK